MGTIPSNQRELKNCDNSVTLTGKFTLSFIVKMP